MTRRYDRRPRSRTFRLMSDIAYIANRHPWHWTLAVGALMFALLYWGAPALVSWQVESTHINIVRALLEAGFARRLHWFRWVGIAIGLTCLFFAAWNAWTRYRLGREGERNVSWLSKTLARWLD